MKKIITPLLLSFVALYSTAQITIFDVDSITFDDLNLLYQAEVADTVIYALENPDKSGVNTSDSVGMFVRGTSTDDDKWNKQIRIVTPCDSVWEVASAIPADTVQGNVGAVTVTMDVWSNVADAIFELSFSKTPAWPNYRHGTYRDTLSTTGQWETLSFTYDNLPPIDAGCCDFDPSTVPAADSVPLVFIAFGHGRVNATADTFYFDNIKMVDIIPGGNDEYCVLDTTGGEDTTDNDTMSLANPMFDMDISIQPNPVKDEFNLSYTLQETGVVNVSIINLIGKEVKQYSFNTTTGRNNHILNVHGLEQGMYLVKINHRDRIYTTKFLKE